MSKTIVKNRHGITYISTDVTEELAEIRSADALGLLAFIMRTSPPTGNTLATAVHERYAELLVNARISTEIP